MNTIYIALLMAYVIGSLPFAYQISTILRDIDPRTVGDMNLGAKNVFLYVGHLEGILVGFLDISKGLISILIGRSFGLDLYGLFVMGFAVVIGHNWSMFLGFQGGQGMATTVGVLLALAPFSTMAGLVIGIIAFLITKHWDISCGIGLALIPIICWFWGQDQSLTFYSILLIPMIGVSKWLQAHPLFRHV
jgi:glycerol-3-phosphate acyltransferase PlsY